MIDSFGRLRRGSGKEAAEVDLMRYSSTMSDSCFQWGQARFSPDYRNAGNETKPRVIQNFLKYAYKELSPYHVYVGLMYMV